MKTIVCFIALAITAGCIPHSRKIVQGDINSAVPVVVKRKVQWTLEQQIYLWSYDAYRKKGIEMFHLKKDATAEDFRPHIAKILGLPESATFEQIVEHQKVKKILTENLRLKIISVFHGYLSTNANWFEMQRTLERIR